MASTAGGLDAGWAAVDDGRFEEARAIFDEAVAALPRAEAYEGLACALRHALAHLLLTAPDACP